MNRSDRRITFFVAVFFFCAPFVAGAHIVPYMAIITELHAERNMVRFVSKFGAATSIKEIQDSDREQQLAKLHDYFSDYFVVLYGDMPETSTPCSLASVNDYSVDTKEEVTSIKGVIECSQIIKNLNNVHIVTDAFSDAFVKYDHYISVYLGNRRKDFILNQWVLTSFPVSEEVIQEIFPEPPPGTINLARFEQPKIGQPQATFTYVIKRFLRMGVEHILSGMDHILFLLSSILLLSSVRKMLALVTAFTIAHSITLVLAGLGIITLPSSVVEPFIAASIVIVTLWNLHALWKGKESGNARERWAMVFAFGLMHGLGFARALVDVDLPKQFFVPALLLFNIGVELGQLLILLVFVPFLLLAVKKFSVYRTRILTMGLGIILVVSLWWFFERLLEALS
ncbi:MAG: membrane protein [Parcubacteria group bacterium Gr01-1014_48]|nr:MAG: membrane protein [Parcubacteria group bacterium Greene0416_14]TSC74051.1 MAG: membrane protein [Parcubacteria group bacterium Gr01-1014_48]TSD01160.1 MAG: membrane protein [Parcubacteria group bacterium Greene1014_15]TSD08236.1 MAG: membrane protein [Parcubacteria group bacterium Greene0714_4]